MKITTTLLFLLLTTSLAFSQKQETIDSDRPGKSISPHTVGKNVLQIQTGFDYTSNFNSSKDIPRLSYNVFSNETNLRYGLLDKLEINGTIGYRIDRYEQSGRPDFTGNGSEKLSIGTRVNIIDHDGLTPAIAASAQLLIPLETDVYYMVDNGFKGTISIKQPITKEWAVTGNIGIFDNPALVSLFSPYTINTSYIFTKDLSAFIEIFGSLYTEGLLYDPIEREELSYDAGIGYLLNNDLLLDFSFGNDNRLVDGSLFVNFGVSFRFGGDKQL